MDQVWAYGVNEKHATSLNLRDVLKSLVSNAKRYINVGACKQTHAQCTIDRSDIIMM